MPDTAAAFLIFNVGRVLCHVRKAKILFGYRIVNLMSIVSSNRACNPVFLKLNFCFGIMLIGKNSFAKIQDFTTK